MTSRLALSNFNNQSVKQKAIHQSLSGPHYTGNHSTLLYKANYIKQTTRVHGVNFGGGWGRNYYDLPQNRLENCRVWLRNEFPVGGIINHSSNPFLSDEQGLSAEFGIFATIVLHHNCCEKLPCLDKGSRWFST
ncbi:hypothetical protein J6590_024982, partial [Homalodisca vitripennis]